MGIRKPLKTDTELRFQNYDGGTVIYYILGVLGYGGLFVVYDGYYINNSGEKKPVRIKECYPYSLELIRDEENALHIANDKQLIFDKYKQQAKKSFDVSNELFGTSGITNSICNTFDFYRGNNTVYIVSSYTEGITLAEYEPRTLCEAVKIILSVAKNIGKIHEKGYLYLDIKPENVFILPETTNIVQLFDFDSLISQKQVNENDSLDYDIHYSDGFAPVEQKMGNKIGPYSDIYGIGALLFYLIFGRTPIACDCEENACFNYYHMKYVDSYQDKLFFEINKFFTHTICSYFPDRYQNSNDAIEQLEKIVGLADTSVNYLVSSAVHMPKYVFGRERECWELTKWLESNSDIIWITGMGGIGKSTVVRKVLTENISQIDGLYYLYFDQSVVHTFTDDGQLIVNNCERQPEESGQDYFKRKIREVKKLVDNKNAVFVLDNFDGNIDNAFQEFESLPCRKIIISRTDIHGSNYTKLYLDRIQNNKDLYRIFCAASESELSEKETRKLDKLIDAVAGHTLVIELIAKQVAKSYLTIDEAVSLAEQNGFSDIAPEKIDYIKDGNRNYGAIASIISSVYDLNALTEDKKSILKLLSMFGGAGIDAPDFKVYSHLATYDDVNELSDGGWLYTDDKTLSLHPLIREMMCNVAWNNNLRRSALKVIEYIYIELNENKSQKYLNRSKLVLENTKADTKIRASKEYLNLLYITVINMPREDEEFIISGADYLLAEESDNHTLCIDSFQKMNLYDYLSFVYCQKNDYDNAKHVLRKAKVFATLNSDKFFMGMYYDMQSDFYDNILDGYYYGGDENDKKVINKLLKASKNAVNCMRQSEHKEARKKLGIYILNLANLIIRCCPERKSDARKLIWCAKQVITEYTPSDGGSRDTFYMTRAWYYTSCEPDIHKTIINISKAQQIRESYDMSKMNMIEYVLVPAANMMCEQNQFDRAIEYLRKGMDICKYNEDIAPFKRMFINLEGYIKDVYELKKDN